MSVLIVCVTQAREKISFNDFYAPPDSNGTVLSRKKYDEICHTLLMCVPKEEGGDPLHGVPTNLKAHCKLLMTKWQRFVMVGGAIQLRRCRGPMPEFHHAVTGEWPKVTCLDEFLMSCGTSISRVAMSKPRRHYMDWPSNVVCGVFHVKRAAILCCAVWFVP